MVKVLLLSVVSTATFLAAAPEPQPFQRPLIFEPNRGQAPGQVQWLARVSGSQFFLTTEGVTIVLPGPLADAGDSASDSVVRMKLTGGRAWTETTGLEPSGGSSNYFLGNNPKSWLTDIPHYARLSTTSVYDGIDLVFYGHGGELEYDFVVAPGADPTQIRMAFEGVERLRVDGKSGDLLLTTAGGSELRHVRPKVYQEEGTQRVEVAGGYEILDRHQATFALAAYDRRRPLVIDPTISFTRFLAGNGSDVATAVAADASGNSYVTGRTLSTNFPIGGAMQADQVGQDAFVTKLSSSGAILFSTYLGGNGFDAGSGIAVDSTGVYVTGATNSPNFPVGRAFGPGAGGDAFVAKISPEGQVLIYSAYLGGGGNDWGTGIAVDSSHAAYVVGSTDSTNFPTSSGPGAQKKFGGVFDAFLTKVAPDGTSLLVSTYLGGKNADFGFGVAVRAGDTFVTGDGFAGVLMQNLRRCGGGAFVVRLTDSQRKYTTCLANGHASAIAVDVNQNAYITGSAGAGFLTTANAFQRTKLSPSNVPSAFLTKLAKNTGGVTYSTYLSGGNGRTLGLAIAADIRGATYVAGTTTATSFFTPPVTPNPSAGFLYKFTPSNALEYLIPLGAAINGVAVFQRISPRVFFAPQIYTTGYRYTGGTDFTHQDAFVVKLDESVVNP